MTSTKAKKSPRRHIRFKPDPGTVASIDLNGLVRKFQSTITALVLNEAQMGCAIIIVGDESLTVGHICKIKVGNLKAMKAEVKWRKSIDDGVYKLGLEFLE